MNLDGDEAMNYRYLYMVSIIVIILVSLIMVPAHSTSTVILPGTTRFKRVIFYYGWISTSNLLDLSFDILVFSGSDYIMSNEYSIIQELMDKGVETYAYLHDGDNPVGMGSSYKNMVIDNGNTVQEWVAYMEALIDNYVGKVDGVFLDECDPAYFGTTDPNDPLVKQFSEGLKNITGYAHSKGLKVFINGVRAYASLGDYYLWELFVTYYNGTDYVIDKNFYATSSSNPYDWVNGIAKYNYLREHGLLNKTIALSFADPGNPGLAKYGYYMARILGLAGWAWADHNIFSSGGAVPDLDVYELGPAILPPEFDDIDMIAERIFVAGRVVVDLYNEEITLPFKDIVTKPVIDGVIDNIYQVDSTRYTGSISTINEIGYVSTPMGLYIFVNTSWTTQPSSGLLWIFIDKDNNPTTGYNTSDSGYEIGAEYMVEVYSDGTAQLFENTGPGWSWDSKGNLETIVVSENRGGTIFYYVEVLIPDYTYTVNESVAIVSTIIETDQGWWYDAVSLPSQISYSVEPTPTIYDEEYADPSYGYSIVREISIYTYNTTIIVDAPHGTWAKYTFILPYSAISKVYKNNTLLPRYTVLEPGKEGYTIETTGSYTKITIQVRHASPVILVVQAFPQTQPLPEPRMIPLALVIVLLVAVGIMGRTRNKQ